VTTLSAPGSAGREPTSAVTNPVPGQDRLLAAAALNPAVTAQ
jgi:hypothetical protein